MEKLQKYLSQTLCLFKYYKLLYLGFLFLTLFPTSCSSLSFDFYALSCPTAELMVKNTVRSASSMDPTLPGKLLRLLFHDCFVEGCDASILLEGNNTERSDPANRSVGGYPIIESAKRVLEFFCPATVSCADIVALAARDAVEFAHYPLNNVLAGHWKFRPRIGKNYLEAGGPSVQIPTGRRDGRVSLATNVRPNIVDTSFTMDQMINIFSAKGLSLDDLVILSGAHTIGSAHCNAFSNRFRVDSKGNFTFIDNSLDREYAAELRKQCPAGAASSPITVKNDPETPQLFDNQYYKDLLAHKGLFQSDSVLFSDGRTKERVLEFANDQNGFFRSWSQSFVRLASLGVKSGDDGEVRASCSVVN